MSNSPKTNPLTVGIELVGLAKMARELGISYQAIRLWEKRGRMPRTEWTGETSYCAKIQEMTDGAVTKESLLAPWPAAEPQIAEAV